MLLSQEIISENYQRCFSLTSKLLQNDFNSRGYHFNENDPAIIDLIQSVIGDDRVVQLIKTQPFCDHDYSDSLKIALDEVKRILYPDSRKNRFLSINDEKYHFILENLSLNDQKENFESSESQLNGILKHLSKTANNYLSNKLLTNHPELFRLFCRIPPKNDDLKWLISETERKLQLFQKFYPNGKINIKNNINSEHTLSEQQIIDCYLSVYLGIERFFPVNFLQKNGKRRSAIITRFLIENILETSAEKVLNEKDETFFIKHKLQNIYRFFNYSFNRILSNAYPDLILPWIQSRTSKDYWTNKSNRINAVRWLIEDRLGINQNFINEQKISRGHFAHNGLSYLFNTYYNSVSSALSEAYPEKEPWELGNVSLNYWTKENSARAVQWLVNQKGWRIADLPEKVQCKEFHRKTFSEFGLATLFEKQFNKNIYHAVSAAWPGIFQPWEFGKVSSVYWKKMKNILHASSWIAQKEGFDEQHIIPAIRTKKLTFKVFNKYSIGQALKKESKGNIEKLFAGHFWQEHQTYLVEQKILRKIKNQNNQTTRWNVFRILLYGLFAGEVARNFHRQQRTYRRISQRISARYF